MKNFTKLMAATSFILGFTCVAQAWDDFAPPTDQQIAHIILTADKAEVDAGNLALQKAQNQALKDFAQKQVKDHSASIAEATALFTKAGIVPADNDISKGFAKSSSDQLKALSSKSGTDFDKAFIAQQIAVHQQVLQSVDQQLIPAAKNSDLKTYLQKFRGVVNDHLQQLQQLQGQIHLED